MGADQARLSARRPDRGQDLSVLASPARDMDQRPSDNEGVRRVGDADGAALAELYQRSGRQYSALARRICVDGGWAQDVVQEVFLTLWREPTRFDPSRGVFATWLLTLIHHRALDAVRKESTLRRRVVAAPETDQDWSETSVPGGVAGVAAGDVRAALHRLPVMLRQVIVLTYFGGHTQREIAVLMGIPMGTVKSRMLTAVCVCC